MFGEMQIETDTYFIVHRYRHKSLNLWWIYQRPKKKMINCIKRKEPKEIPEPQIKERNNISSEVYSFHTYLLLMPNYCSMHL
jgi:hypothetical protein